MKAPSPPLLEKEQPLSQPLAERGAQQLPSLPIVTYLPIGNPFLEMNEAQRRFFLESVLRIAKAHSQYGGKAAEPMQNSSRKRQGQAAREAGRNQNPEGITLKAQQQMAQGGISSKAASQMAAAAVQAGPLESPRPLSDSPFAQKQMASAVLPQIAGAKSLDSARDSLARELSDYSRGDEAKLRSAMGEFESRLSSPQYKSADLMAVLLLVVEDSAWGGEEGAAGSASHFGARVGANGAAVPELIRQSARDSSIVRLASVREMLRYYFQRHPEEYASALAAALGITSDREGDQQFLQERLATELAHIGGFALAQKVLAELKRRKKLEKDAERCMLELGYNYDRKKKMLIIGKRTCGKIEGTGGILGMLLASVRKKGV